MQWAKPYNGNIKFNYQEQFMIKLGEAVFKEMKDDAKKTITVEMIVQALSNDQYTFMRSKRK